MRLPAAAADADGSVAVVIGGGGVMVCGPSYFHGEGRKGERHSTGSARRTLRLICKFFFVTKLAKGDHDCDGRKSHLMSHENPFAV